MIHLLLLATLVGPLVIGDSLARGAYASTPDRAYVSLVGGTFASARTLPEAEAAWAARSADYATVVLEVGINDSLDGPLTPAWEARYAALTAQIAASGARVVCVTPFDVGVAAIAADLAARADAVRRACAGRVADLYAVSRGRGDLRARIGEPTQYNPEGVALDDIHPNDAGHALIAERVRVVMRPHQTYIVGVQIP